MLRSMTGFGASHGVVEGIEYVVEIRSVNNRYYKANMKLPESWASAEAEFEQLLRRKMTRGSVTLMLRMKIPDDKAAYRVNTAALSNYIDQLRVLEIEANPTLRIDLGTLLQLPGVCEPPPLDDLIEGTQSELMKLVDKAVDELLIMRQKEGNALKADLADNCAVIERALGIVIQRAPTVIKDYQTRLCNRVAELLNAGTISLEQESLAREVAIYAERSDVAEEITRLSGHVKQFREIMDSPEPAGRKLDFIAQEMLREANTIGSKSNDLEIAHAVVEIKTAIDRIKEQAANAE